jgi:succinate dehydrogenase/fumarate reductase cytochrome b subunit
MGDIFSFLQGLLGVVLALIGSAMIPNGSQRWGAAIFAAIGVFVFFNFLNNPAPAPFSVGLGIGLALASAKLATGIRFL